MRHALAIALLLAGCAHSGGQQPSHPVSYGSSSGTHVYRTSALGEAVPTPGQSDQGKPPSSQARGRNDVLIGGLIVLGASYGITVGTGQILSAVAFSDFDRMIGADRSVELLWIPVLGAWSGFMYNEGTVRSNCTAAMGSCDLVTAGSLGIAIGAVTQTTGLVLTLYGLLKPPPFKAPVHSSRIAVIPHGSPDGGGVVVVGSF